MLHFGTSTKLYQKPSNCPLFKVHVRVSDDAGKTWSAPVVMDHGEGNLGVSHGVFLSYGGRLWAFQTLEY